MGNVLITKTGSIADCGYVRRHPFSPLRDLRRWMVVVGFMTFGGVLSVVMPVSVLATGEVKQATCPNEQLRLEDHSTLLPACRAYELVSPSFKDGYFPNLRAAAPDGNRVLFESLGTYAESVGNYVIEGTVYESSRTSTGWQAKAISPPGSTFAFAEFRDASRDLSRTLWSAHTKSQSADAEDLYIREPNGSFTLVGPQLPPSHDKAPPAPYESRYGHELIYAGGSSNLSHVFFNILPFGASSEENIVWPGDTTLAGSNARSLYEYSGVKNTEPKLVGVRNVGHLSNNSEAEMITQCGVELGGGLTASGYNAVSDSGNTVFFTAKEQGCENEEEVVGAGPIADEIYARLDEAETVDISEPTHENCETCDTASPKPAFFEGASQDGARAFFLSEQEGLLPGAKGMNLYEYNLEGLPRNKLIRVSSEVTEPQVQGVARVSKDGSHVYFVAKGVLADNKNFNGEEAAVGNNNLYMFNSITGAMSFIAILAAGDQEDWKRIDHRPVEATPDGKFFIFPSIAHLTPDDTSGSSIAQLFEYDAESEELARVSIGQKGSYVCTATGHAEEGYNCDGNTENSTYAPGRGSWDVSHTKSRAIDPDNYKLSSDGTKVVFESLDPLTPQAVNSLSGQLCSNVYEYRWSKDEGGIVQGNIFLASDGQDVAVSEGRCGSQIHGIDLAGLDVFIESTDRLVSQDTDTQRDIYDAREGGGYPAESPNPGCGGDACQGSLSVTPQLFAATSDAQMSGNSETKPVPGLVAPRRMRSLTRAQKLAKALSVCRRRSKRKKVACELKARKTYGNSTKAHGARDKRSKAARVRGE